MESLRDDIDVPMRKSVALLNLLGIHTVWSCCGFNYEDQPEHKNHDYGMVQVYVDRTQQSLALLTAMLSDGLPFRFEAITIAAAPGDRAFAILRPFEQAIKNWNNPQGPHFHEIGAQYCTLLESYLTQPKFVNTMANEVTLVDSNQIKRQTCQYWAYKPREPWVIRKADIL